MTVEAPGTSTPMANQRQERAPFMAFVGDEVTRASLLRAACEHGFARAEVFQGGLAEAREVLALIPTPHLLVVDLSGCADPLAEVGALFQVCDPGTRLVALGILNDVTLYRELTALGVEDYVLKPISAEASDAIVARGMEEPAATDSDGAPGKLIAVIGARGGAGASTAAVNIAWIMAHEQGLRTALVDLDLYFGSIALALDVEPGRGFREALENPSRIDSLFIERAMVRQSETLFVLGAEEALDKGFSFDPAALDLLIEKLRHGFDRVVVDLPRFAARSQAHILSAPAAAVVVTDPTLAGMRDTLRLTAFLRHAAPDAEVRVVLNKVGARQHGELDKNDFEAGGGVRVDHRIPADPKTMVACAGAGKALAEAAPRSRAAAALRALSRQLSEAGESVPKAGLWRRLVAGGA